MILINPPLVKPSEPPAGLPKLAGALEAHGITCTLLDANLEGILYLLDNPAITDNDTWTRRAVRNITRNLSILKSGQGYGNTDRYRRAIGDLNRVLDRAGRPGGISLTLSDYADERLSPLRSRDLIAAAENPEGNIFFPYFSSRLDRLLESELQHRIIGLSINFLSQALCAFSIMGFLRKHYPSLRIVVGGGLITSWMGNHDLGSLFAGLIDKAVQGPGEIPLLSLLGQSPHASAPQSLPSYQGLPTGHYLAPGLILPYPASHGCYWGRCSFCPENAEGNRYSPLSFSRVPADLRILAARHNPVLLHLVDNALSPALLASISNDPPGVPWYGFARITKELADADFCAVLRTSGCAMLKLGLESGDQGTLDSLDKGIDLEIASRALKALKGAGIATYVYFLFGTPAETPSAARKTLDYIVRHSPWIDYMNLAIFNMPLNCAEAGTLDLRSFYDGDLSLYTDFIHPKGWGRREIRLFIEKDLKMHAAVRPIILRQPPCFTSNHAPLFCINRPPADRR
ncbi:MAG: Radical SAM superfamily protein [Syntrophorhabdaceae bacterium PtaU1.Bin034]|nr:MAG: Radical SAM superfamily protein [Syntrophorhabdaceae bacterium PtaU1.Bin034]